MGRKPDLTDNEIDRLIVEHVGPATVEFIGPDGDLVDGYDTECTPRERAIFRAAIHWTKTYHANENP